VVLGEELAWNTYLGCGLILLGVMIVNGALKLRWPQLSTASSH
jgi:drug/metabolite transporter (DMT)-like permease